MNFDFDAVIFDLDGTLVDSEGHYKLADTEFLARYNITLTPDMTSEFVGMGSLSMIKKVIRDYHLKESPEELLKQKDDIYLRIAKGKTTVFPEMRKLLEYLDQNSIPMSVASGSSLRVINETVKNTGLSPFFRYLVSADEVKSGKPAPDIFLETARRMNVSPEKCLVFEDSKHGVNAAYQAGMTCTAIPTLSCSDTEQLYCHADILYKDGMKSFSLKDWLKKQAKRA